VLATGRLLANGGNGGGQGGGGGSGGAIRLIAETLSGSGTLSAVGGTGGAGASNIFGGATGGNGRIRLEALFFTFNTSLTTGSVSTGAPGVVILPNMPSVRIVSVNGTAVPATPIGLLGGVDVILDSPGIVPVVLAASRVPLGTTISVTAKPESDRDVIGPVISDGLTGTFPESTTTVNLEFPAPGLFFIEARATFTLPAP
jgi:hypothetical protein